MASLRAVAACIGCPTNFSIVRNFFGYASPPPWNQAPPGQQSSLPQSLSVSTQIERLNQKHFHLDLIRVGVDSMGLLSPADEENLDCAVQIARNIYGAIGVGIGRVNRSWIIPLSDNTGFDVIDDDCEAVDLVDEYSAPGGGIDVFLVQSWVGDTLGMTPAKPDGVVVESRENNFLGTARTFGHFFGLDHQNDKPNNLMCQTGSANPMPGSTQLNSGQISAIKDADEMHSACQQ